MLTLMFTSAGAGISTELASSLPSVTGLRIAVSNIGLDVANEPRAVAVQRRVGSICVFGGRCSVCYFLMAFSSSVLRA